MSPIVNDEVYHFGVRGVYNALSLVVDDETESYWDHITGECLYGPLQGYQLSTAAPLLHLSVSQALAIYQDVRLARPKQSLTQRAATGFMNIFINFVDRGILPPDFRKSMGEEDTRLPRLEIGLGVWSEHTQCFFPTQTLTDFDDAFITPFDGRSLLIYIDPTSRIPGAIFTHATNVEWGENNILWLDTGEYIFEGALHNAHGDIERADRPLQLYARWYGFAYTFPGCDIYEIDP